VDCYPCHDYSEEQEHHFHMNQQYLCVEGAENPEHPSPEGAEPPGVSPALESPGVSSPAPRSEQGMVGEGPFREPRRRGEPYICRNNSHESYQPGMCHQLPPLSDDDHKRCTIVSDDEKTTLLRLVDASDAAGVRAFLTLHVQGIIVNRERRALQLTDCGGAVSLHIPLTGRLGVLVAGS
jgi:hypothetical protein